MKKSTRYSINVAIMITFFVFTGNVSAQWTNYQNAEYVIGQPDFTTYTSINLFRPTKVAIDFTNSKLYLVDRGNNRVLRYAYPITGNNPTVERIFGTGTSGETQNQFSNPLSVAVYNGTLWVSDQYRILRFNNAHLVSSNGPNADGILGSSDYTSHVTSTTQSTFRWPNDIAIDESGNMWVVDRDSHRIIKFSDVNNKGNGANADLVLGQADFTSMTTACTQSGMYGPNGVDISGTTVWVADQSNYRVLRFDNPTTNGQPASGVLGQSLYTTSTSGTSASKMNPPSYVAVDNSGRLYVSDYYNARVMIFNTAATKINGADADNVIGQVDFTSLGTTNGGQNGFFYNFGTRNVWNVTVDEINNKLFVADYYNNRILQFAATSPLPVGLTLFSVLVSDGKVALKWQTASEVNNFGFEVERIRNYELGIRNWEKIGFVHGSGNSNSPKEYSLNDKEVTEGKYVYRLKQIDSDGKFSYSQVVEVVISQLPKEFVLMQNYPNPFNPSTIIGYQLDVSGFVTLKVYDVLGNVVATLVNEEQQTGKYSATFDATNNNLLTTNKFSSGVYYYMLKAGNFIETKGMIYLK